MLLVELMGLGEKIEFDAVIDAKRPQDLSLAFKHIALPMETQPEFQEFYTIEELSGLIMSVSDILALEEKDEEDELESRAERKKIQRIEYLDDESD